MLIRAYRLTDKLGIVLLKLGQMIGDWVLDGLMLLVGSSAWGVGRVGQGLFSAIGLIISFAAKLIAAIVTFVFTVIKAVIGLIVTLIIGFSRLLRFVILRILSALSFVAALLLNALRAVFSLGSSSVKTVARTTRRAAGQTVSSATSMAQRHQTADVDVRIIEDPLRVQNRALSVLLVVLGIVVVGVLLWATDPSRTISSPSVASASGDVGLSLLQTPDATVQPIAAIGSVATPIPTATQIPEVLQSGGAVAYVVQENGQSDIWGVEIGSSEPIRLTNDPADERSPAWSPADVGRKLAYSSRKDGNWEIYVYDLDAQNTERITFDLSFQDNPQWSPDGAWLVYESYQGGNLDIYAVPVDGSASPVRFTDHPAPDFSPAWSPSGRQVAYVSWRDNNQEIYLFDLDTLQSVNITNTPIRNESHPQWSPDGDFLTYSAVDQGSEKVFVQSLQTPGEPPQVISRGRTPSWSPDGFGIVYISDASDSSESYLYVEPFNNRQLPLEVIGVLVGATDTSWTNQSLPPALINAGGLELLATDPLFVEQEVEYDSDPRYRLDTILDIQVRNAVLNDRVNDSFNALREKVFEASGVDFLSQLDDAFWEITRLPQPGEERRNWHLTGRAFSFPRNTILGFPPPIELVREEDEVGRVYWRVFVRVSEDAQSGQLGEPLRHMPWDMLSRSQGDVEAYNQGGRLRGEVPPGYYVDLTALAANYGWQSVPAGSDWRANANSINYWMFVKTDGLDWYSAMREIYAESQLGGFVPTPTPAAVQVPESES